MDQHSFFMQSTYNALIEIRHIRALVLWCKYPPVAILPSKTVKTHSIRVCIPKKICNLWIVKKKKFKEIIKEKKR